MLDWEVGGASPAPSIVMTMHPEPWRGWVTLAGMIISVAGAAIAWVTWLVFRSRRLAPVLMIAGGILPICFFLGLVAGDFELAHLGVAGDITGRAFALIESLGGILTFLSLIGGLSAIVVGAGIRSSRHRFPARPEPQPPVD